MTQDDLEARVRRLELIELAKVATVNYARACDAKDVTALRTRVFTDDAVLRVRDRVLTGVEVADFYTGAFAAEPGTRRHFLTNQIAEVVGTDSVRIDSYFLFVSEDAQSVIGWGAYQDVVVVPEAGPRIADKRIIVDVRTDLHAGWAVSPIPEGLA